MNSKTFFQGTKVVELASVLAGPAVGMFFAELGADVIKIENKTTDGDVTRSWRVPEEDPTTAYSAYYCSVNWGKTVQQLDLRQAADQAVVHALIQDADIVISNFKPDSARQLRMDYAFLQTLNARLIYGQITGFGDTDDTVAFDVVLQAAAGFLYMNGEPGRQPVKMPVALIDLLAAHQLKAAMLVALLHRERTGEGSYVSVSLFESAVASLANQASNWLMAGHIPQPMGTQHPNIAPYGDILYTVDDKPVVLAAGTERQFQQLCTVLQIEPEELFRTNADRVKNRAALLAHLQPAAQRYTRDDLLAALHQAGVPAAAICTMPEVFEHPLAKNCILEWPLPDGRTARCVKTVVF